MLFNAAYFSTRAGYHCVMTSHRLAILAFAALAVAGCRTRPEQRAVMDSYQEELRRYEGIIYDLEYDNEILCLENDRLKSRLARLEVAAPDRVDEGPRIFTPRRDTRPSPRGDSPRSSTTDDMDLSPPVIERDPTPDRPPSTINKPVSPEADPSAPAEPTPGPVLNEDSPDEPPSVPESIIVPKSIVPKSSPKPSKPPSPTEALPAPIQPRPSTKVRTPELLPATDDKKVSQLYIDPRHTRGVDVDQQGGDDALHVVIEPRNAHGEFIPEVGNVSVVLLDPARQGEAARVGRWDFNADMVRYQLTLSGKRNIPLQLPWSDQKPQNSRLQMFVRMEIADGQKVEASREVNILLPGQISSRWTPRPPQRRGPLTRQMEIANDQQSNVAPASHEEEAPETAELPEWTPYR